MRRWTVSGEWRFGRARRVGLGNSGFPFSRGGIGVSLSPIQFSLCVFDDDAGTSRIRSAQRGSGGSPVARLDVIAAR